MKVIINSDDFGYSVAINNATAESLCSGLISSTTMLVNQEGFDDAVHKVHTEPAFKDRLGIHLNLTEGRSLTEKIRSSERFCNSDGYFTYQRQPCWHLNRQEKEAIYEELNAQIERCVRNNIVLTHIDSHHQIHSEWGISPVVIFLAKKFGIKKIRLSRNIGAGISLPKKVYKSIYNKSLLLQGMTCTRYFGDTDDFDYASKMMNDSAIAEIMVHAMYNKQDRLIDYGRDDLSPKIRKLLATHQLIGYKDL